MTSTVVKTKLWDNDSFETRQYELRRTFTVVKTGIHVLHDLYSGEN